MDLQLQALNEGESSALRSSRFTPEVKVDETHWSEGWVGIVPVCIWIRSEKIS
jgi:hypothetical protein